jgi:hypothetical protein
MKKTILLFLIILSGIAFSQSKGIVIGDGVVWTDSVGYGTGAVGSATASDSVFILNTRFSNEWYRIFIKGNAHSTVDSVKIQAGTIRYYNTGVPKDTIWGSFITLKDSAWNTVNTIVNNTTGKDYTIYNPIIQLLKFSLLNYRAASLLRNVTITINAKK